MAAASASRSLRLAPALALVWLLALMLALVGLGQVPLRDWDEGIVARVALEISRAPWPEKLLPTYWADPYLNKPPAIHLLIAAMIALWRSGSGAALGALPPEWVVRLGPALVSSLLPPLLGLVQLRLRPGDRASALATAALALTLMPLVRNGRLAMLDGAQLVALASLWWALLSVEPGGRRGGELAALGLGIGAGLATSLLLLLKAPAALPLLLAALALRLLERDLGWPVWRRLLLGLALGLLPGLGWHLLHGLARGSDALAMWTSQGFARVGSSVEGHGGGPLPPLLEVLKGGWPWLPLWPFGLGMAWGQRQRRWGLWGLGLTLVSSGLVLPLRTQLPWYSLLLWPPFCLLSGPVLASLVRSPSRWGSAALIPPKPGPMALIPRFWMGLGCLLLISFGLAAAGLVPLPGATWPLTLSLGVGLLLGGWLLLSRRPAWRLGGAGVLVAGVWLTLLLLLAGPLWLWELNETWPVQPVADLVRHQENGPGQAVRLWQEAERPSLNWYAGRRVLQVGNTADLAAESDGVLLLARQQPEPEGWRCRRSAGVAGLDLYHCSPKVPGPP